MWYSEFQELTCHVTRINEEKLEIKSRYNVKKEDNTDGCLGRPSEPTASTFEKQQKKI